MNRACRGPESAGSAAGVTRHRSSLSDYALANPTYFVGGNPATIPSPAMQHLFDRRGQCGIGVMIFGKNPKLDDLRR